jgi:hypothetical protein
MGALERRPKAMVGGTRTEVCLRWAGWWDAGLYPAAGAAACGLIGGAYGEYTDGIQMVYPHRLMGGALYGARPSADERRACCVRLSIPPSLYPSLPPSFSLSLGRLSRLMGGACAACVRASVRARLGGRGAKRESCARVRRSEARVGQRRRAAGPRPVLKGKERRWIFTVHVPRRVCACPLMRPRHVPGTCGSPARPPSAARPSRLLRRVGVLPGCTRQYRMINV